MGQDYKTRARPKGGPKRARAATGPDAELGQQELVDQQSSMGNAAVSGLIGQEQSQEEESGEYHLPESLRWKLLADNEHLYLAAAVYGETEQISKRDEFSEEMWALAQCGYNQVEHTLEHPEDQMLFGAESHNMRAATENTLMFEEHGMDRYRDFFYAARFGKAFTCKEDLETAIAVITTAESVINEEDSPLADQYMVFSERSESPVPERTDASSRIQYGRFYFWAFAEEEETEKEEEEEEVETDGALMSAAAAASAPIG